MGAERIPDFWRWWENTGRAAVTDAVRTVDHATVNELLQRRGLDFDKSLSFDVRRGTSSEYRLSLSSGGAPRGRVMAERWFRAAPAADSVWQFAPALPHDRKVLEREHKFSRYVVRTGQATINWVDGDDGRYDVELLHPRLPAVPPGPKATIIDKILIGLLGEDETVRWIGNRSTSRGTEDGRPLPEFAAHIAERESERAGGAGRTPAEQRWKHVANATMSGRILLSPSWLDDPVLDQLTRLALPDGDTGAHDELVGILGDRVRLAGEARVDDRTVLFLYTDSADLTLTEWLTQWGLDRGCPDVVTRQDPGWGAAHSLKVPRIGTDTDIDFVEDTVMDDGDGGE